MGNFGGLSVLPATVVLTRGVTFGITDIPFSRGLEEMKIRRIVLPSVESD